MNERVEIPPKTVKRTGSIRLRLELQGSFTPTALDGCLTATPGNLAD